MSSSHVLANSKIFSIHEWLVVHPVFVSSVQSSILAGYLSKNPIFNFKLYVKKMDLALEPKEDFALEPNKKSMATFFANASKFPEYNFMNIIKGKKIFFFCM